MTRLQMMTIALAMAETSGRNYVQTTAELNAIANRRMEMFAAATKCLYDDAVVLTLQANVATYDLRGAQLSKRVLLPDLVTINGTPLYGYDGQVGMISLDELRHFAPGYLGSSAGRPERAAGIPPQTLRLWPKPDQVYTNCYVAGAVLPADIDTSAGGDSTAIAFADEDGEAVALYVGLGLIEPTEASTSDYERMAVFSRTAADRMRELMTRSQAVLSGPSIRGSRTGNGIRTVSLG